MSLGAWVWEWKAILLHWRAGTGHTQWREGSGEGTDEGARESLRMDMTPLLCFDLLDLKGPLPVSTERCPHVQREGLEPTHSGQVAERLGCALQPDTGFWFPP